MRRVSIAAMIGLVFLGAVGIARPAATKAEDDFQLVKVAEGVYAGIAKSAVYKPASSAFRDYVTSGLIIVIGVGLIALAGIFTVARR